MNRISYRKAAMLLLMGLGGCYYPVPVYTPYPPHSASDGHAALPYAVAGRQCREYDLTITMNGRTEQAISQACEQPNGQWKDAYSGAVVPEPPGSASGSSQMP